MHGPLNVKVTHGIQSDYSNTEGLIKICQIIGVYYVNHMKHTNAICKQTSKFRMLKQAVY